MTTRPRSVSAPATTKSPYESIPGMWSGGINARNVEVKQPFAPESYDTRLAAVRREMAANELDALVLTAPDSIYYLTAYQTPGNPFTCLLLLHIGHPTHP